MVTHALFSFLSAQLVLMHSIKFEVDLIPTLTTPARKSMGWPHGRVS